MLSEINNINISEFVKQPTAELIIGSTKINIYNRRFSWFHRKMVKLLFGFELINLKGKGE